MNREHLVQTKLTPDEHDRVKAAAATRGLSIAAYVRLAALGLAKESVAAWVIDYGLSPSTYNASPPRADYVLHPTSIAEVIDGPRTYLVSVLGPRNELLPLPPEGAAAFFAPDVIARKQFVVYGSTRPWFFVDTLPRMINGVRCVELVLRPEDTPEDFVRRRIWEAAGGELFFDLVSGQRKIGKVDAWTLGPRSGELKLRDGGTMTLLYERVDGVGSAVGIAADA